MLERKLKFCLQKIMGYHHYLFVFAKFCITRMGFGHYEKSFVHFMQLVPSDGIILDIGANIGVMSVLLARKFPRSSIYAFEPIPSNILTFKRIMNSCKISNVTLIETAVGNKNGEIKMALPIIENVRYQGLCHILQQDASENEATNILYTVPIAKLDDALFMDSKQSIVAIKMDVENYEFEVLKGARELINKHKPIVYTELWSNEVRGACIDFFKKNG